MLTTFNKNDDNFHHFFFIYICIIKKIFYVKTYHNIEVLYTQIKIFFNMKPLSQHINESFQTTESSEENDPIMMAIEYLVGEPISRYHDEANNYAYQLLRKSSTGWLTISRKSVDDTVKHHFES